MCGRGRGVFVCALSVNDIIGSTFGVLTNFGYFFKVYLKLVRYKGYYFKTMGGKNYVVV